MKIILLTLITSATAYSGEPAKIFKGECQFTSTKEGSVPTGNRFIPTRDANEIFDSYLYTEKYPDGRLQFNVWKNWGADHGMDSVKLSTDDEACMMGLTADCYSYETSADNHTWDKKMDYRITDNTKNSYRVQSKHKRVLSKLTDTLHVVFESDTRIINNRGIETFNYQSKLDCQYPKYRLMNK